MSIVSSIVDWLLDEFDPEEYNDFDPIERWVKKHPRRVKKLYHKYIAVSIRGKLIDSDVDAEALHNRMLKRLDREDICIGGPL